MRVSYYKGAHLWVVCVCMELSVCVCEDTLLRSLLALGLIGRVRRGRRKWHSNDSLDRTGVFNSRKDGMWDMGEMKNACKILIGNTWSKDRLGISQCRSEIGILGS